MKFELKTAAAVGDVKSKDEHNSLQFLNITAGIVDCPYNFVETTTVEYVFENTLSLQEVKDGMIPFAEKWVATNYPSI